MINDNQSKSEISETKSTRIEQLSKQLSVGSSSSQNSSQSTTMAKMMKMSMKKSAMKSMMKRKVNQYMQLLNDARRSGKPSFSYNGKTYVRGMAGSLVVYKAKK